VHLTAILSKVAERLLGAPLISHLAQNHFGANQWAFTKQRSARDLSTLCICTWLLAICRGKKIALYLSDISGAFDKVFKDFLLAKLYQAGVGDTFLNFLNAYLSPRIGYVTIEGAMSDALEIADSVFQGTVLGPILWKHSLLTSHSAPRNTVDKRRYTPTTCTSFTSLIGMSPPLQFNITSAARVLPYSSGGSVTG